MLHISKVFLFLKSTVPLSCSSLFQCFSNPFGYCSFPVFLLCAAVNIPHSGTHRPFEKHGHLVSIIPS